MKCSFFRFKTLGLALTILQELSAGATFRAMFFISVPQISATSCFGSFHVDRIFSVLHFMSENLINFLFFHMKIVLTAVFRDFLSIRFVFSASLIGTKSA